MPKKSKRKEKPAKKQSAESKRDARRREDCPECGSIRIIYSETTDRYICKDCRAIFSELAPEEEQKFKRVLES